MKPIEKDELFDNLKGFLKSRGVELQEGSYTHRMQQGCGLLADMMNLSQQAFAKARDQVDKQLDQMRQIIHEHTAPKAPPKAKNASEAAGSTEKKSARTQAKAGASKTGSRLKSAGKKKTK